MAQPNVIVFGRPREDGICDVVLVERLLAKQAKWGQLNQRERRYAYRAWAEHRRAKNLPVDPATFASLTGANTQTAHNLADTERKSRAARPRTSASHRRQLAVH